MIGHVAEQAITILFGAFMLPILVLLLQVLATLFLGEKDMHRAGKRPSLAIIMPARDEALVIVHAITSAKKQMSESDRIIVIADNCSDETQDIAKQAGAEVLIRRDPRHMGKGYALAAAVSFLASTGPREVVVILDADCLLGPDALGILARACADRAAPIQALYSMGSSALGDSSARVAEFAWRIKTQLRPTGYSRLGLPCSLMGSGMAFPWHIMCEAKIGTDHIAEDVLLGLDLTLQGNPPWFCPSASVVSQFPSTQQGRDNQRRRWIHGYLAVAQSHFFKLIARSIRQRDVCALALAADLLVPPLGSLGVLCFGSTIAALILLLAAGWTTFFFVTTLNLILLLSFLLMAWWACGRDLIGLQELARLPSQIILVVRICAEYLVRKRSAWVRTERK
jgi:cellulose synthase/poly-beta-1,6-N-acetylglucosamine synthase-like glycosyltransferase